MIEYQTELLRDIRVEMQPLLEAHHDEISMYKEDHELDVNWDLYFQMEDLNVVHTTTVRSDGKLIGYYISLISPSLHHSKHLYAICDVVFIMPIHRKGRIGLNLFKKVEEDMCGLGVSVVIANVNINNDFSPILTRLGWTEAERSFIKKLKVL